MAKVTVESELKKLKGILSQLPEAQQKLNAGLIEDAAFQRVQLEVLREQIEAEGCSEEYNHGGGQFGTKQSVAMASYLQLQKQYLNTMRLLNSLMPGGKEQKAAAAGEALAAFVAGGK